MDLGLEPIEPPQELFHGTARTNIAGIKRDGLKTMTRQHVHLSLDQETALKVGMRHGKPIILRVAAHAMYEQGYQFFCSANGVWLCAEVPVRFLSGFDA